MRRLLIAVFLITVASCASKRPAPVSAVPPPIKSIAVVGGDLLANAVSGELFDQGFRTFEVPATQDITPRGLWPLVSRDVDAVLVVKSKRGDDLQPDSSSVQLLRTKTGETVAAFSWMNTEPRRKIKDAAREIVATVLKTAPKPAIR